MHTPEDGTNNTMLSEAEMRRVLARAGELDAVNSFAVSEAELVQVAGEAGISRAAVQQALLELRQSPQPPAPVADATPAGRGWRRFGVSAAIGAALGLFTNVFESPGAVVFEWTALIAVVALVARSVQMAIAHRPEESASDFQAELAALWAAFAASYLVTGGDASDALGPIIAYWMGMALIGAGITSIRSYLGRSAQRSDQFE